jgi:iron complex outermembrane recepter protein
VPRRGLALAFGLAGATLAFAPEAAGAEPAEPAAPSAPGGVALDAIVVTAQRRSENLEDVPLSVAVFGGDALLESGVTDAMRLQTVVPSLTYSATGNTAQPYLRGIGTRIASVGLEPSIATYVDDRYVARPFAAIFDMLDIERVEVLKGPQGTLYGRNAAGGAIRAITKDPGERSVAISGRAGNYDARRLEIAAGGPLSGSWRGQVAGAIEQRDGLATNLVPSGRASADDIDRLAVRGKLLWDVADAAKAKLTISWWKDAGWRGRDLVAVGLPQTNRGAALFGGITSRERDKFASALADDNRLTEAAADLRFDVALRDVDFVSITTYAKTDLDQTLDVDASSVPLLDLVAKEPSETWSQEFQLVSHGGRLEWLAGAFLYGQDASNVYLFRDSVAAQPAFPAGTDVSNGVQQARTDAYALFAQASRPFAEHWAATLGARWSRERKDATLDAAPNAVTNAPTPYADARHWDKFTPHVSLEYRRDFGLAYLTYARGFKSGGYNYPASLNPVLNPETVDSYEIGLKTELAGKRVRVSSALFFYDFNDLQVTRGGVGAFLTTENAASADIRGLEVDADVAVSRDLSLKASIALIHSEYTDYTAGALVPLTVSPYGSAALPGGFDARGHALLRSPDRAAYLGLHYERRLAGGGRIPVSVDYSYKGDYYFDFSPVATTEWLKQEAYGLLNARVAYAHNGWELGFWGANLTDASYYEDAVVTSLSSRVSYADPRTYGVDFKLRL